MKTSFVTGPNGLSNAALTASVTPDADAVSVYPLPSVSILQPANVAIPDTAALGLAVHVKAAPDVPVPAVMASVTGVVLEVTVLPYASRIVTFGCDVQATPTVAPLGWPVKRSREAAPIVALNALLAIGVRPAELAVSL